MRNSFIRVLIADDHALLRDGLKALFDSDQEIFIIGEVTNGYELVNKYFELKPDVTLLDIEMPALSSTEALKIIKQKDPNVKALFLSKHEGEEYLYSCLNAGANGFVGKTALKGELKYAIKKVANGEKYYGIDWNEDKIKKFMKKYDIVYKKYSSKTELLTPREKNILRLISKGFTSIQIAEELNIGKRTVDFHRTRMMHKYNIKSVTELIWFAIQNEISMGSEKPGIAGSPKK